MLVMSLPIDLTGHRYAKGKLIVKGYDAQRSSSPTPSASGFWFVDCKRCGRKNVSMRGQDISP
jgi:hypothetical protein